MTRTLFFAALCFAVLLENIAATDVLQCYKCAVTVEKYMIDNNLTITTPMCSKFVESPEYMVDCPYSTMCLKTISIMHLQNGQQQETITRGCAQQKNTTQVFRNRQWEPQHVVQEVYQEGCTEIKGNNFAGSTNTHCYCRGQLCNTSSLHRLDYGTSIVILVFYAALKCALFN